MQFNQQAAHHNMLAQKVAQQLQVLTQQHHMQQQRERVEHGGAQPRNDPKFEAQRITLVQQLQVHKTGIAHAAGSIQQIMTQQAFLERQFQEQQINLLPLVSVVSVPLFIHSCA